MTTLQNFLIHLGTQGTAETPAPASGAAASDPALWWVGGIIVAVAFTAIVVRTLRRNRLRK